MGTTVVTPQDRSLHDALRLAALFAVIKLLLHIATNLWQTHLGYGYFRDELYYLICGRRLAWGYVDQGPLVAVQARLTTLLFGDSITGVRMLTSIAGATRVFITGILAWSLGGRRPAQTLAMIGVLACPQFLAIDSFLSMNSVEPIFWMTCLLALILMVRGGSERLWLLFGASAGLGLLNKASMTFFLFALLFALLLTPQRKLLASRWAAIGTALLILIALPNLIWQVHHHWATFECLRNVGRHPDKNPRWMPWTFMGIQILYMEPLTLLLWGTGLVWLLRSAEARLWRWLGVTYLLFIVVMMVLHGKDYYISPIYPVLFAAGGIAWERFFAARRAVVHNRAFAFPVMESALIVLAIVTLPWAMPVLRPATWLHYMKATHFYTFSTDARSRAQNQLPLFFADRLPWDEEVAIVTRTYRSLSPEDQKKVGILCLNYGEASAINFLGRGLPSAISGITNYYLWGPGGATGEVLIAVTLQPLEAMQHAYDSVEIVGRMDNPYASPSEHLNIYLLRGRHKNLIEDWPHLKDYY
jgi:hypothetical protein